MALPARQPGQQKAPPPPPKSETRQWREWRGVNVTDSRTAIEDTELAWLENALSVGKGALQILPRQGDTQATIDNGIATMWGVSLNGNATLVCICMDGSIQAFRLSTGVVTQ